MGVRRVLTVWFKNGITVSFILQMWSE